MKVSKVFISTYRYDFHFAKVCIASIRYWYPDIPIYLIKDENKGKFDTSYTEKLWNVNVLDIPRKKFGWGYGKLETLFLDNKDSFFVIDADAVITGPVLDVVENLNADFVVDKEVQPEKRFNEIYFRLDKIHELDRDYSYPGYSFNSGQWFGTSSLLKREDFNATLNWSYPASKDAGIVFNNDQTHLNYVIHKKTQSNQITVSRIRLMVWPVNGNDNFIDFEKFRARSDEYPFVIHWAGMSGVKFSALPRQDILRFYKNYYYSRSGIFKRAADSFVSTYLNLEKNIGHRFGSMFRSK